MATLWKDQPDLELAREQAERQQLLKRLAIGIVLLVALAGVLFALLIW